MGSRRTRARGAVLAPARRALERLLAYASCAELVLDRDERIRRCLALRAAGVRAAKIRFHRADWREDVADLAAVRDAVGPAFELMVDANHGWRMPGDLAPRWDVATAAQCARELERLGVYWLEEPLRCDDPEGYRALRGLTDIRIAAGEMARTAAEARDLVVRGGVDVVQCDVVLVGRRDIGLPPRRRARRAARSHLDAAHLVQRLRAGRQPAPRARGLGLPLRRGARSTRRRCRRRGATGCCRRRSRSTPTAGSHRPPGPGLGVVPDFDALERWRIE